MNASRRNTQSNGQRVHAQSERCQVVFAEDFARMNRAHVIYKTSHINPLVIIDHFDFDWPDVSPYEAGPPLAVDTNAVLSLSVTLQCFEMVAGWRFEKIQCLSGIQLR